MKKLDDLTFYSMYSVLQSGMWLLNDLETYLRPLGISQAKLSILLAITSSEEGVVSPHELAMITGKSRPGITRTIESLAMKNLIRIDRDFTDGRRKKLSLTQEGLDLLERIIPEYNRHILAMSSDLSEEEKQQLISILGKINFLDDRKKIRGQR